MQWPPLRDFPAVYILVRLSFVEPLSSDFWFVSGADLLPMQQHNATLPEIHSSLPISGLESCGKSIKFTERRFLQPDLQPFFRLLPQQGGPCFPQGLSTLLAAVGVHLVPQLDLFRGESAGRKTQTRRPSEQTRHTVNALSIRPVFQSKLAYTFSQSSLKAEATLVPNTSSGSKFMGI